MVRGSKMNPIQILRHVLSVEKLMFSVSLPSRRKNDSWYYVDLEECALYYGFYPDSCFRDHEHMVQSLSPIIDAVCMDFTNTVWNRQDRPCAIIQRAWRKYRLRTSRKRNDLIIRGLSEFFWHPSLIDFETGEIRSPVHRLKHDAFWKSS